MTRPNASMTPWIDSHNHLQDKRLGDAEPVIAAMKQAGVSGCVVNATREAEWQTVENLAAVHLHFIHPAFGIHPWHAHSVKDGWQERLKVVLESHPQASLGECGIDHWIEHPPTSVQRPVFTDQLRIARELDRPVTIHCLKGWGELFECFDESPPPPRFLMHSFGGSIEVARRLIPLGAYFSFSGYFLQPRKAAVIAVFKKLPRDRILLETDAPDMLPPVSVITHSLSENNNHPANLPAIGAALATAIGMTPAALADLTRDNARRWLGV